MTLYEIDEAILSCVDLETGEIVDSEKLEALTMERNVKIENVIKWIKQIKIDIKAIADEVKRLQGIKKSLENRKDGLTNWLDGALDGQKFKTPLHSASYRTSKAVEVDESVVDSLPEEFKKIEVTPRKTEIKAALEGGAIIEGCSIVERTSLVVK